MINKYYEIIWFLKKIYYKIFLSKTRLTGKLRNPYREYLFQELKEKYGKDYFENKRILEVGPKDGEDTLRLDSLSPSKLILNDFSMKIEPGEVVSLLGPSGCGKTTLLKLASGIEKIQKGKILLNNKLVSSSNIHVNSEKRKIGYVFPIH